MLLSVCVCDTCVCVLVTQQAKQKRTWIFVPTAFKSHSRGWTDSSGVLSLIKSCGCALEVPSFCSLELQPVGTRSCCSHSLCCQASAYQWDTWVKKCLDFALLPGDLFIRCSLIVAVKSRKYCCIVINLLDVMFQFSLPHTYYMLKLGKFFRIL